ncbi:uncharacterized protein LOC127264493 isoform X2 [Andrographis paniculata]|uniref:uncharacterized protein LOC127264493 isoform X2 n=1 Tax=Andrographis paniculata TaxID=175694 RepID=UPI0021E9022A|nr:uncharacterized protein LOC127264493 isoform X2 [Andrographis paniculata]
MEELQKLQQLQTTMEWLHSAGISDANSDCQRFLADFTTLLMHDYGTLDIASKCGLISKNMSKISSLIIGGALQGGGEGDSQIGNSVHLHSDEKVNPNQMQRFFVEVPMVGIDAMMRSNSTLEDFCRSYFMFHKMEANCAQSIFKYLPILSFTESFIYQLDGLNEKLLQSSKSEVQLFSKDFKDDDSCLDSISLCKFGKYPFGSLINVLESHGLLTERISKELNCGVEYWALERKLCHALANDKEISIQDVTNAIHLKSFDYRVLNLLLYQLRGDKVNELHMEFLSASELLVEVSDDLFDYEDDVVDNNFNILRMFIKYYGAIDAPIMLAQFITNVEKRYNQLLIELDSELSAKYQKRCEEATREGGKMHGPSLGTWHIPPIIADEAGYRAAFSGSSR